MLTHIQFLWALFFSLSLFHIPSISTLHVHIVYLGLNHQSDPLLITKYHVQILSKVFSSEADAKEAMLYSYMHSFSGFAATLNSTHAKTLAKIEGVISVFRSKSLRLHTTRSWDFMGLTLHQGEATPLQLSYGDDVVVGIFDTGIWPESDSFQEMSGMGPIPSSWKGTCVRGERFDPTAACNRKLIGARYYLKGFEHDYGPLNTSSNQEYRSARDWVSHGTHTASTAVGSIVKNASFLGFGRGTARGGAPKARLAVYKICWSNNFQGTCSEVDILAAFDDAIRDGVNVISASFGSSPPLSPFFSSSLDIGSFHASQNGIAVVSSAGNDGPDPSLVQNVAPWSICVAATTIDRTFPTEIRLGNNISIMGEGLILQQMKMNLVASTKYFADGVCDFSKWTGQPALREMILCFSIIGPVLSSNAGLAVFVANGSGLIFAEPMTRKFAQVVDFIPTVHVDIKQGTQILNYITSPSSKDPTVEFFSSKTIIKRSPAPTVAYFSSRGPSSISPNILKPDISAPGVNILAAWSPQTTPSLLPSLIDRRSVNWNLDSGTSMSCPHVSGVVALLKSAHPDWSPAAIKSALMTTAYTGDTSQDNILAGGSMKLADPFDIGAGHINPLKALDPGLIYDMDTQDYILFLCSIGYTKDHIIRMVIPSPGVDFSCPKESPSDMNLNYPAITVSNLHSTVTIKRTLRNVGHTGAIYSASVVNPQGVGGCGLANGPSFLPNSQKITYYVTLTPLKSSQERFDFGEIVWFDGHHHVRSPIIVCVNNSGNVDDTTPHSSA